MKSTVFGSALLALMATSVQAELYNCRFPNVKSALGWIAPVIVLNVQRPSGDMLISDPVIQMLEGAPIEPRLLNESDRVLSVSWDVVGVDRRSKTARMQYTMVLNKQRLSANVRAVPIGYSNVLNGRGKCAVGELPKRLGSS